MNNAIPRTRFVLLAVLVLLCLRIEARDADYNPPEHIHLSLSEDPTVMNVVWTTFPHPDDPLSQHAYVEYGESQSTYPFFSTAVTRRVEYGEKTEEKITVIHHAKMFGLKPATRYFYRVGSPKNNWSRQYQFITPPQVYPGDPTHVRFAAFGDMGIFTEALQTVDLLETRTLPSEKAYDFILHVGDMAYAFGNWTKWNIWFSRTQRLAAYTPYMISPGNRDETEITKERFVMPSLDNTVASYSTSTSDEKALYLSYDKEKPYLYYTFDYGFLSVVSISIKDNYSVNSEQYQWLEKTLKQLSIRVSNSSDPLQWIVVIGHTPLYSSSDGHTGGNKELKVAIEHLLVEYGVHMAVWGDDHNYERTYPVYNDQPDTADIQSSKNEDGPISVFVNPAKPIHLLVGTAGIGLDGWQNMVPPEWSAYREINHGFVEFDVTESYLRAKFVRSKDRSVGDQFWIVKHNTTMRRQAVLFISLAVIFGIALFLIKERNIHLPLPIARKHT